MEKIPTYSYEDAQNGREVPETLMTEDQTEGERGEIVDRIMSHGESPEEIKIETFKSRMANALSKGWTKIKTPKAKVQQDWEITKAQRESPRNN